MGGGVPRGRRSECPAVGGWRCWRPSRGCGWRPGGSSPGPVPDGGRRPVPWPPPRAPASGPGSGESTRSKEAGRSPSSGKRFSSKAAWALPSSALAARTSFSSSATVASTWGARWGPASRLDPVLVLLEVRLREFQGDVLVLQVLPGVDLVPVEVVHEGEQVHHPSAETFIGALGLFEGGTGAWPPWPSSEAPEQRLGVAQAQVPAIGVRGAEGQGGRGPEGQGLVVHLVEEGVVARIEVEVDRSADGVELGDPEVGCAGLLGRY